MEHRRNTKGRPNSYNRTGGNGKKSEGKFHKKRNFEGSVKVADLNQRQSFSEKPKSAHNKFPLGDGKALCSFFVCKDADIKMTVKTVAMISQSVEKIVVSIPVGTSSIKEELQLVKSENVIVKEYTNGCESKIHNSVFSEFVSDIFIVINSNAEPREYSVEILKKYLSQDGVVATVPTVYTKDLQVRHYCLRFPTLLSYVKVLCGVKTEKERLMMMERGESGYYRIHRVDASKSQLVAVNSLAFKNAGMFPIYGDSCVNVFKFYKNIMKCGTTLFVPTARIIEHSEKTLKRSIISRICYMMCNVF